MRKQTQPPLLFPARFPLLVSGRILAHPPEMVTGLHAVNTPLIRVASDHLPLVATLHFSPGMASL